MCDSVADTHDRRRRVRAVCHVSAPPSRRTFRALPQARPPVLACWHMAGRWPGSHVLSTAVRVGCSGGGL